MNGAPGALQSRDPPPRTAGKSPLAHRQKQSSFMGRLFFCCCVSLRGMLYLEWTLEPESAEVFDLCYGFCFPLRCCRFWQPRLDFPNTALDCGIFAIYILIVASDFEEGKGFFFKNRQVGSNFIETGKQLYSILLPAL